MDCKVTEITQRELKDLIVATLSIVFTIKFFSGKLVCTKRAIVVFDFPFV